MTEFTFRPAVRDKLPLIIGIAGGTGSGKTYSAMRMATGMAGGKRFAVIDTEAGRAKHYADQFQFDHGDLVPPFSPDRYLEAIQAADKAGYPVIVVDSMSHEWAGDGGVLDMQDAEHRAKNYSEGTRMASWIKPKQAHKRMMSKLLQVRAHLILCFRAEPKIDMVKRDGKTVVEPKEGPGGFKGWLPICEKNLPYELVVSFLMMAEEPGIPKPIKFEEQFKPLIPLNKHLDEMAGQKLAEWAKGGSAPVDRPSTSSSNSHQTPSKPPEAPSNDQVDEERFGTANETVDDLLSYLVDHNLAVGDVAGELPKVPEGRDTVKGRIEAFARANPDKAIGKALVAMMQEQGNGT